MRHLAVLSLLGVGMTLGASDSVLQHELFTEARKQAKHDVALGYKMRADKSQLAKDDTALQHELTSIKANSAFKQEHFALTAYSNPKKYDLKYVVAKTLQHNLFAAQVSKQARKDSASLAARPQLRHPIRSRGRLARQLGLAQKINKEEMLLGVAAASASSSSASSSSASSALPSPSQVHGHWRPGTTAPTSITTSISGAVWWRDHFWILLPGVTSADPSGEEMKDDAGRVWRQIDDKVGTGAEHVAHAPGELRPVFDETRATPGSSAPPTTTPAPIYVYTFAPVPENKSIAVPPQKKRKTPPTTASPSTLSPLSAFRRFNAWTSEHDSLFGATEHSMDRLTAGPAPSRASQTPTVLQTLVPAPAAPRKSPVSDDVEYLDSGSKVFPPDYEEGKTSPPVRREYIDDGSKVNFDAAQSFRSSAMHFLHASTKPVPKTIQKEPPTAINDEQSPRDASQESYFVKSRPQYDDMTLANQPRRNEVTHGSKRTDHEPYPEDSSSNSSKRNEVTHGDKGEEAGGKGSGKLA